MLQEYEQVMENCSVVERTSLMLEWNKKRKDAMAEYFENKSSKNIIEHVMKNALETEVSDDEGNTVTLAEQFIFAALKNEADKGITLKTIESLMKLTGGGKAPVVVQGELTLSAKAKELAK